MKKMLILLLLGGALIAAEVPQTHRLDNLANCYRLNPDGSETNIGQPADAIANNPSEASGIQRAALKLLSDFQLKQAADLSAAKQSAAAQITAAEKARDDAIAAHTAAKAAEIAALKERIAALEAAASNQTPKSETP